MTPDERSELLHDAEQLAYQTIRFTGLYKELFSDEWDQLAERLGRVTLRYVEALVDEEFTRLESAKESANGSNETSTTTMADPMKLLSDDEVAEIEARANAATPRYCVDWEKGRHALLQDSGWRSTSEEQPRTIATFDRENGYLDLLFCAEARTDIPALCATVRALRADLKYRYEVIEELRRCRDRWLTMLNPPTGYESVDDAIHLFQSQLAQVTQSRDSAGKHVARLHDELVEAQQMRGLVIMSALINFVDWLSTQGVIITNAPEARAAQLRGELVKEFLAAHSEGENYFKQADQIAERLGEPFQQEQP